MDGQHYHLLDNLMMPPPPAVQIPLEKVVPARSVLDERISPESEEEHSKLLEKLMEEEFKTYETLEQKRHKEDVLIKLGDILDTWMKRVKLRHGYPEDMQENGTARLMPYGSYKLGVSSPSGDIDSLILAPNYVDRIEDFFGLLYGLLQELAEKNPMIEHLTAVNQENTIMPLIKMDFYKV